MHRTFLKEHRLLFVFQTPRISFSVVRGGRGRGHHRLSRSEALSRGLAFLETNGLYRSAFLVSFFGGGIRGGGDSSGE